MNDDRFNKGRFTEEASQSAMTHLVFERLFDAA